MEGGVPGAQSGSGSLGQKGGEDGGPPPEKRGWLVGEP